MEAYAVELTRKEALFLSDQISAFSPPPEMETQSWPPLRELVLKLGAVLHEHHDDRTPCVVHFTGPELWLMREYAKSTVMVGGEKVGLELLMKIYQGLLAIAADVEIDAAVNQCGEVVQDEPSYQERLDAIDSTKHQRKPKQEDSNA